MAVFIGTVQHAWHGSTGSISRDGGAVNYTAIWHLQVDNSFDQAQNIIIWWQENKFGLGTEYAYANDVFSSLATCDNIRAERKMETTDWWNVIVTYSREADDAKQTTDDEHTTVPTDYRPIVRASSSAKTKVGSRLHFLSLNSDYTARIAARIPKGDDGPTMPVNSNLKPFEPFPEIDDYVWWISVEQNLASFDGNQALVTYVNKEDTLSFSYKGLTIGPKKKWQCKIRDCELEFMRENTIDFWKVRYYVEILPGTDKFWHVLPDLGWESLALPDDDDLHGGTMAGGQGGTTPYTPGRPATIGIVDVHGHPVRSLVPLDGDGHADDVTVADWTPKVSRWWEGKEAEFSEVPVLKEVFSAE